MNFYDRREVEREKSKCPEFKKEGIFTLLINIIKRKQNDTMQKLRK